MFKPGQQVVYSGKDSQYYKNLGFKLPKPLDEILTIKCACPCWAGHYDIYGYEKMLTGEEQSFSYSELIPVEDWTQAETMVEVLKEDLELVEVI